MPASLRTFHEGETPVPAERRLGGKGLDALSRLGSVEIETSLLGTLSDDLHTLFDPISEDALPIYFGPLLGRLYLEGL